MHFEFFMPKETYLFTIILHKLKKKDLFLFIGKQGLHREIKTEKDFPRDASDQLSRSDLKP